MIIIVNTNNARAQSLAEILRYMGIISLGVTLGGFYREFSHNYKAILLMSELTSLPDAIDTVKEMRVYSGDTPIYALCEGGKPDIGADAYIDVSRGYSHLTEDIRRISEELDITPPGRYVLAGVDADTSSPCVKYFDTRIPFTRTETLIVRYMIATYPTAQRAEDILRYAFKPTRTPERSSIRTHISSINRKFRAITGRSMIQIPGDDGYMLMTPEIISKTKLLTS